MKATEYQRAWEAWSSLKSLEPCNRTGRLAAFYEKRHHIFLDVVGGRIAAIELSDRRLRIEYVMMRLGIVTSDDVRQAFHDLEKIDRITPLSHVLLERGTITVDQLARARQQQMIEALQTLMMHEHDALMFIPGPVTVQKVEAIIRIDDAIATAFAEFRLDQPASNSDNASETQGRFSFLWSERAAPSALTRQAR